MSGRPGRRMRVVAITVGLLLGAALGTLLPLQPAGAQVSTSVAAEPLQLQLHVTEPRAFGHQVGDRVERVLAVDVPAHLRLDAATLPAVGAVSTSIELAALQQQTESLPGGERLNLTLTYQLFASPPQPRAIEIPTFELRFEPVPGVSPPGGAAPRTQDLRVEGWPLFVSPLLPEDGATRRGLGDLQPDAAVPARDTAAPRRALIACLALGALLGGVWLHLHYGLSAASRRARPFALAWRTLRRERRRGQLRDDADGWRAAARTLHAALDAAAGQAVFASTLEAFVAAQPGHAALRADWQRFFAASRAAFYADAAPGSIPGTDLAWLLGFARACRDAERVSR